MDNRRNYIYEIKDSILQSPIRKRLTESENIPFKKVVLENLNNTIENIKALENNKDKAVKLVIVGEVKSGKSSLLNALIGKEVSTVDVLEATSSIIEVIYDKENKTKKSDNITQVRLNIEYLKKINIVDTPGLKSITIKNEQKTLNYIQNADLILFVIDATHIGQEDILESLDLIAQYRKPIVGIVNKADLLEDNKQEVMEYIKDEYGIYIDDFFMISSYLEYQDKMSKNVKAGNTDIVISNYNELKENFKQLVKYIEDTSNNYKAVKEKSLNSSLEGIIHKEIVNHHEYKQSLFVLVEELKKHERLLQNKFDYVKSKMEFEVNDWCNRVFLSEELSKIKADIESSAIYINEIYINDRVNKKKIELDELFFKEWSECLKEISDQLDDDIKKYIDKITYRSELLDTPHLNIDSGKGNINEMLATVGSGAILGATSGGIISMYTAAIGSSAASVTIGTALITYCPPLLIAGTISGALGKVIYDKVKSDKNNKEILNDIDNFIDGLKYKIIEALNEGYFKASQEIVFTTTEILKNLKGIYTNKYDIEKLSKEIEAYIEKLKKYISN
ncbi:dynamin family protein [Romboutsia sp.]|uniref:dynamin family protein n=1 Tax=Romboutsia sp. TaxID=1965302 RepID=UPI003F2C2F15